MIHAHVSNKMLLHNGLADITTSVSHLKNPSSIFFYRVNLAGPFPFPKKLAARVGRFAQGGLPDKAARYPFDFACHPDMVRPILFSVMPPTSKPDRQGNVAR
jgi:hypothetical protein